MTDDLFMTRIAIALRSLANLMMLGRCELAVTWHQGSLTTTPVVRVNATSYPADLDNLQNVITANDPDAAWNEHVGISGMTHHEMRGTILGMDVELWVSPDVTPEPEPAAASDPAADDAGPEPWYEPGNSGPGGPAAPRIRPYIAALPVNRGFTAEVNCGLTDLLGPLARDVDDAELDQVFTDHAELHPLLELVDEMPDDAEPGQSTRDLTARYAGMPGVVVVPGGPPASEHDRNLRMAWSSYACARALHHFRDDDFASVADAHAAIAAHPIGDMLEPADVDACARKLVETRAIVAESHSFRESVLALIPRMRRRVAPVGAR